MGRRDIWELGLEYRKQFKTEEEIQNVLRDRMIKCIKDKRITQRNISKRTKINEGGIIKLEK